MIEELYQEFNEYTEANPEKDFLEGIFVYIHTLDDELSDLLSHMIKEK